MHQISSEETEGRYRLHIMCGSDSFGFFCFIFFKSKTKSCLEIWGKNEGMIHALLVALETTVVFKILF